MSSVLLSRFVSLCGDVAVRHLVHLELAVLGELKRRSALVEEAKSKAGSKGKGRRGRGQQDKVGGREAGGSRTRGRGGEAGGSRTGGGGEQEKVRQLML